MNHSIFQVRIRWFDQKKCIKAGKVFEIHECNDIPAKSIICSVKTKRVSPNPMTVMVGVAHCKIADALLEDCKNNKDPYNEDDKPTETSKSKSNTRLQIKKKSQSGTTKGGRVSAVGSKRKGTAPTATASAAKKPRKIACYAAAPIISVNPLLSPTKFIPAVAPSVDSAKLTRAVFNKQYDKVEALICDKNSFTYLNFYYKTEFRGHAKRAHDEVNILYNMIHLFK